MVQRQTCIEERYFTHIVVGAGSAGCVITARIVENPSFNVLLIEAGLDYAAGDSKQPQGVQDARRVPMKGQSEIFDAQIDWDLMVDIPGGRSILVPQAKIIGGGSSINGGTALRSTQTDSAEWVELGNDKWDFETVYHVYQSMEDDEVRGTRGPCPITRTPADQAGKIQKAFLKASIASGFQQVIDFNTPGAEGVGPSPVCRRGDRRISASETFIDPIRDRKNLTVLTSNQVDRVTFSGKRATGVILTDGRSIFASEEVIVSAGAIFSPAILQRSGIGPSELLHSLNLPVVADLPVGKHLSDHLCIPLVAKPREGAYSENDYSLQMQARWSSSLHPGYTDLQLICFSYLYAQAPDLRVQQRNLSGTATGHVAGIGCNLNKPTSLGTVQIRSKNPMDAPIVAPRYLQTNHDRKIARQIVRKAYHIFNSSTMQAVLHRPIGLDDTTLEYDHLLDRWIESQYSTTYHFCGTCRMASRKKDGVVDQSGRVYGTEGLRVCDASIIPTAPAANNMWPTMMFAQRIGSSVRDGRNVGKGRESQL